MNLKLLFVALTLLLKIYSNNSLVYHLVLEKTDNGCKGKDFELKVGEMKQDPLVCGVIMCMDKKGNALIYYCQRTPDFALCNKGVDTTVDFPQCCWECVYEIACTRQKSGSNDTAMGVAGDEDKKKPDKPNEGTKTLVEEQQDAEDFVEEFEKNFEQAQESN